MVKTTNPEIARCIRVFVSSLSDVATERKLLDQVVEDINQTDAHKNSFFLQLFKWERKTWFLRLSRHHRK
jgi:hypothetical protein